MPQPTVVQSSDNDGGAMNNNADGYLSEGAAASESGAGSSDSDGSDA